MDVTTKPGSELVQLPTITAAQRQLLISVLETENRRRSAMGARKAADSVVALAHALDLHRDAVRAPQHDGQGACDVHPGIHAFRNDPDACIGWVDVPMTPSDPVLQCFDCGKRTDEYAGLSCRASHLHKVSQ